MSEEDHHDLTQDRGLLISADALYLDLYRLITIFGGSRGVADFAANNPRARLYDLIDRFERSEASRLLISVAVICRSALDYQWMGPIDGNALRFGGDVVGWLEPSPGADREELHFREACNKIIHALGITISRGAAEPVPFKHLDREIRLTGERGTKRWVASIDIWIFAECAYNSV